MDQTGVELTISNTKPALGGDRPWKKKSEAQECFTQSRILPASGKEKKYLQIYTGLETVLPT